MKKNSVSKIAVTLAGFMIASVMVPIAACKKVQPPPDEDNKTEQPDNTDKPEGYEKATYAMRTLSVGGIPLANITVNLVNNGTVLETQVSDENGYALFNHERGNYTVSFENLPAGYSLLADSSVAVTTAGKDYNFGFISQVIEQNTPNNKLYAVGDVMYDFTATNPSKVVDGVTTAGKTVSLANYINTKDKKAVIINFWYTGCTYCETEFPIMNEAYNAYKDDIAIIALDPIDKSNNDVVSWRDRLGLDFDMALDTADVASHFTINGYPTTIVVDRYGVITEMHTGAIINKSEWTDMFAKYSDENYSQKFTPGESQDIFIPDKPKDFDKYMPASADIKNVLSPTIENINYSIFQGSDSDDYWPWEIVGDCLVPSNRKDGDTSHRMTTAVLSATFSVGAGQVIAFDYKTSSHSSDTFQVAVYETNSEGGIGTSILNVSGIADDFATARNYIALSEGIYEVAFIYFKDYTDDAGDDCVYLKNLRVEDRYDTKDPLDVNYYVARDLRRGVYNIHDTVYLADDGYYHVSGHKNSDQTDPYLLLDLNKNTPYNRNSSIYDTYIRPNNAVFGGKNYYKQLSIYSDLAFNSDNRLVPVTKELQTILNAIAEHEMGRDCESYSWTEFCQFTVHYGDGPSMTDPILGRTHFSAIEAVQYDGTEQTVNNLHYPKLLNPAGMMYKFTPETSGAYHMHSILEPGVTAPDGDPLEALASLFAEDDLLDAGYFKTVRPISQSDSDDFIRTGAENNFHIYYYLEAGETYYLTVYPSMMNQFDVDIPFVIEYLGPTYEVLESCTAGFYVGNITGSISLPTYCTPELHDDGYYYTENGTDIYVDFIYLSRMFNTYTIEEMLTGYFYTEAYITTDEDGNIQYDSLNNPVLTYYTKYSKEALEEYDEPNAEHPGRVRIYPFKIDNEDYTEDMLAYYNKMKAEMANQSKDDLTYGMVRLDEKLQHILDVFIKSQLKKQYPDDVPDSNEWMKACYFIREIKAGN